MRILFTIGGLDQGGKERRMISLLQYLSERGVELGVLGNRQSPQFAEVEPLCEATFDYVPGKSLVNLREHIRAIREFRPDIVHSWNGVNTTYAIIASAGTGCSVITSEITNAKGIAFFSAAYWRTRFNFYFSRVVLSNSNAGLRAKRAPIKKSVTIYNGYRLERLESVDKKKYLHFREPETFNVIMAARFCPAKDYATVLEAAKLAQEEGLKMKFFLAGDGPDLERVREKAEEEKLYNVTFLGLVTDIDNLFCYMDAGILATDPRYHQEGIPNSLMECMAHGKPVVATEGFAIPEIVSDRKNGFIVDERDATMLFERLRELMLNPELGRVLGERALETIGSKFNIERMGGEFLGIYEDLTRES